MTAETQTKVVGVSDILLENTSFGGFILLVVAFAILYFAMYWIGSSFLEYFSA